MPGFDIVVTRFGKIVLSKFEGRHNPTGASAYGAVGGVAAVISTQGADLVVAWVVGQLDLAERLQQGR